VFYIKIRCVVDSSGSKHDYIWLYYI